MRVEDRGGRKVATHFNMAMPYLVLDNPVAIASGREIFGYFKQAGRVACPGDPGNPAEVDAGPARRASELLVFERGGALEVR